ncbi:hypothetical protein DWY73_11355 [Bacteroides fragilis]|uniref:Uncharacterized protein n=2 Tax=Bacteroides fragilis TaxID=817 RepID=A0A5C6HA60_BACFG|nr:hypothetical protein F3B20_13755 [Bacteroides fragilis]KAA4799919.1 hypothetical protein F3B17_11585 [Bacteroides fragilis]KAA4803064.1 hypothetical protein F2045_10515 [Bacteroides fragilis]KAA4803374.1 hypothetical protein F2048_15310 [Bacteroides fragilis]KAA4813372.1 hypothetical protein F2050_12775 [Bacteroides fragilis]
MLNKTFLLSAHYSPKDVFLNVRLKTHQKRVIYYEKGYIKMKRENINPNNYHLFENEVISIKIEVKNKSFY